MYLCLMRPHRKLERVFLGLIKLFRLGLEPNLEHYLEANNNLIRRHQPLVRQRQKWAYSALNLLGKDYLEHRLIQLIVKNNQMKLKPQGVLSHLT